MTSEHTLLVVSVLLVVQTAVVTAGGIIMGVLVWKTVGTLMWFHRAGRGMAENELEKRRLDLEAQRLENDRLATQAAMERSAIENRRGHPERVTVQGG